MDQQKLNLQRALFYQQKIEPLVDQKIEEYPELEEDYRIAKAAASSSFKEQKELGRSLLRDIGLYIVMKELPSQKEKKSAK